VNRKLPSSHLSIVAVAKHQRALHHHAVAQIQAGQQHFELHGHVAARVAVGGERVEGRHPAYGGDGRGTEEIAEVGASPAVLDGEDGGDYEGMVVWGGVGWDGVEGWGQGVKDEWMVGWNEG
jgi:hypothetical protein